MKATANIGNERVESDEERKTKDEFLLIFKRSFAKEFVDVFGELGRDSISTPQDPIQSKRFNSSLVPKGPKIPH
jgi:hypothetical protein